MDKNILHDITYGMYVVSTKYKGKNVGCIANTFSQITSKDMVVSLSLNKQNFTNKAIKKERRFALSIISQNSNPEVIGKFGFFSSKNIDKFENFSFEEKQGLPVLNENMCGYLILEVVDIVETSTHDIFLAKIIDGEKQNSFPAMTYSYYHSVIKGSAPKTAPTYIEKNETKDVPKYKCNICGYIYEGEDFENLPLDWKCPICGVSKENFSKIS